MILSLAYLVMGFFSICIAGLPLTYYAFCESRQQLEWNESKKLIYCGLCRRLSELV